MFSSGPARADLADDLAHMWTVVNVALQSSEVAARANSPANGIDRTAHRANWAALRRQLWSAPIIGPHTEAP